MTRQELKDVVLDQIKPALPAEEPNFDEIRVALDDEELAKILRSVIEGTYH